MSAHGRSEALVPERSAQGSPMNGLPLLIEVLARDGEVLTRHRIERLPATIGRGYDNDVIVDDPFVAPLHLTLVAADGEPARVVARDAVTRNGVYLMRGENALARWFRSGGERTSEVALAPSTTLRIGHTLLRVRRVDAPVAPELVDTVAHGWDGGPAGLAASAGVLAIALANTWIGDTEAREALQTMRSVLAVLGGAALWAAFWAIFNRIFAGRLRYGRHLFIVACALVAAFVWEEASEVVAYALSAESIAAFNPIGGYLILGAAVYHHLAAIRPTRLRMARNLAATLVVALVGFSLVQNQINSQRLTDDLYLSALKPPVLRLAGETPSAAFFDDARTLKESIDLARKDLPGDDEAD